MAQEKEKCEGLQINLKAKKRPRFKAGAELSSSVNSVDIGVDHTIENETEMIDLSIKIC